MPISKINFGRIRFTQKILAIFVSLCLIPMDARAFSLPAFSPSTFGRIEEFHQGKNGKTIFYIQDAHSSFQAQESIYHLIDQLTVSQGVRTVFEEGYEGRLPLDQIFKDVPEKEIRQKVAYFLLDRLGLSAAEYAYINRKNTFRLVGIDQDRIYRKNIQAYRQTSKDQKLFDQDLKLLSERLERLARERFPNRFKKWRKLKTAFDGEALDLADYLKQSVALVPELSLKTYRFLQLLLITSNVSLPSQRHYEKMLKHISPAGLFLELDDFESRITAHLLTGKVEQILFRYLRDIALAKRLLHLEISEQEFEIFRFQWSGISTREMADFVAKESRKSVVLYRGWEQSLPKAIQFYELAKARDQHLGKKLKRFSESASENAAVLVFGGFHKEAIRQILIHQGYSFYMITPNAGDSDKRHENYYKQIMQRGVLPFEVSAQVKTAAIQERLVNGDLDAALGRVNQLADAVRQFPNLPPVLLHPLLERGGGPHFPAGGKIQPGVQDIRRPELRIRLNDFDRPKKRKIKKEWENQFGDLVFRMAVEVNRNGKYAPGAMRALETLSKIPLTSDQFSDLNGAFAQVAQLAHARYRDRAVRHLLEIFSNPIVQERDEKEQEQIYADAGKELYQLLKSVNGSRLRALLSGIREFSVWNRTMKTKGFEYFQRSMAQVYSKIPELQSKVLDILITAWDANHDRPKVFLESIRPFLFEKKAFFEKLTEAGRANNRQAKRILTVYHRLTVRAELRSASQTLKISAIGLDSPQKVMRYLQTVLRFSEAQAAGFLKEIGEDPNLETFSHPHAKVIVTQRSKNSTPESDEFIFFYQGYSDSRTIAAYKTDSKKGWSNTGVKVTGVEAVSLVNQENPDGRKTPHLLILKRVPSHRSYDQRQIVGVNLETNANWNGELNLGYLSHTPEFRFTNNGQVYLVTNPYSQTPEGVAFSFDGANMKAFGGDTADPGPEEIKMSEREVGERDITEKIVRDEKPYFEVQITGVGKIDKFAEGVFVEFYAPNGVKLKGFVPDFFAAHPKMQGWRGFAESKLFSRWRMQLAGLAAEDFQSVFVFKMDSQSFELQPSSPGRDELLAVAAKPLKDRKVELTLESLHQKSGDEGSLIVQTTSGVRGFLLDKYLAKPKAAYSGGLKVTAYLVGFNLAGVPLYAENVASYETEKKDVEKKSEDSRRLYQALINRGDGSEVFEVEIIAPAVKRLERSKGFFRTEMAESVVGYRVKVRGTDIEGFVPGRDTTRYFEQFRDNPEAIRAELARRQMFFRAVLTERRTDAKPGQSEWIFSIRGGESLFRKQAGNYRAVLEKAYWDRTPVKVRVSRVLYGYSRFRGGRGEEAKGLEVSFHGIRGYMPKNHAGDYRPDIVGQELTVYVTDISGTAIQFSQNRPGDPRLKQQKTKPGSGSDDAYDYRPARSFEPGEWQPFEAWLGDVIDEAQRKKGEDPGRSELRHQKVSVQEAIEKIATFPKGYFILDLWLDILDGKYKAENLEEIEKDAPIRGIDSESQIEVTDWLREKNLSTSEIFSQGFYEMAQAFSESQGSQQVRGKIIETLKRMSEPEEGMYVIAGSDGMGTLVITESGEFGLSHEAVEQAKRIAADIATLTMSVGSEGRRILGMILSRFLSQSAALAVLNQEGNRNLIELRDADGSQLRKDAIPESLMRVLIQTIKVQSKLQIENYQTGRTEQGSFLIRFESKVFAVRVKIEGQSTPEQKFLERVEMEFEESEQGEDATDDSLMVVEAQEEDPADWWQEEEGAPEHPEALDEGDELAEQIQKAAAELTRAIDAMIPEHLVAAGQSGRLARLVDWILKQAVRENADKFQIKQEANQALIQFFRGDEMFFQEAIPRDLVLFMQARLNVISRIPMKPMRDQMVPEKGLIRLKWENQRVDYWAHSQADGDWLFVLKSRSELRGGQTTHVLKLGERKYIAEGIFLTYAGIRSKGMNYFYVYPDIMEQDGAFFRIDAPGFKIHHSRIQKPVPAPAYSLGITGNDNVVYPNPIEAQDEIWLQDEFDPRSAIRIKVLQLNDEIVQIQTSFETWDADKIKLRSELRSADEQKFRELIDRIIAADPNNAGVLKTMHRQFFKYFIDDLEAEKRGELSQSEEARARMSVINRLRELEEGDGRLLYIQAFRDQDKHYTSGAREVQPFNHPKFKLLDYAYRVKRVLEGRAADQALGEMQKPEPHTADPATPRENLERYILWQQSRNFLGENPDGKKFPDPYNLLPLELEWEDMGLTEMWRNLHFGFEPQWRPEKELAEILVNQEIDRVEFVAPDTLARAPLLRVYFRKPFEDKGINYEESPVEVRFMDLAILSDALPYPDAQTAFQLPDLVLDHAALEALSFASSAKPGEKVEKIGKILDLAFQRKIISNGRYYFYSDSGIRRFAKIFSRTPGEEAAVFGGVKVNLVAARKGGKLERLAVKPEEIEAIKANFEKKKKAARFVEAMGLEAKASDPEYARRIASIGSLWEESLLAFAPTLNIVFLRNAKGFIVDSKDIEDFRASLAKIAPMLVRAGPAVREAADRLAVNPSHVSHYMILVNFLLYNALLLSNLNLFKRSQRAGQFVETVMASLEATLPPGTDKPVYARFPDLRMDTPEHFEADLRKLEKLVAGEAVGATSPAVPEKSFEEMNLSERIAYLKDAEKVGSLELSETERIHRIFFTYFRKGGIPDGESKAYAANLEFLRTTLTAMGVRSQGVSDLVNPEKVKAMKFKDDSEKNNVVKAVVLIMAAGIERVRVGIKVSAEQGKPNAGPEPKMTQASPAEYTAWTRKVLQQANAQRNYLLDTPTNVAGDFDQQTYTGEDSVSSPFAILPIIAYRRLGFQPTLDVVSALVENGVESVKVYPGFEGNPPYLVLKFFVEVEDKFSKTEKHKEVAVVLLNQPWDFHQAPQNENESQDPEMDMEKLREIEFEENTNPNERMNRVAKLLDYFLADKAAVRSRFQLSPNRIHQVAETLGRTPEEVEAIETHFRVQIAMLPSLVIKADKKAAKAARLRERFEKTRHNVGFLAEIGAYWEMALLDGADERIAQLEAPIRKLMNEAEYLRYLFFLPFVPGRAGSKKEWLLTAGDVKLMGESLQNTDVQAALIAISRDVEPLRGMLGEDRWLIFHAELLTNLNHQLLAGNNPSGRFDIGINQLRTLYRDVLRVKGEAEDPQKMFQQILAKAASGEDVSSKAEMEMLLAQWTARKVLQQAILAVRSVRSEVRSLKEQLLRIDQELATLAGPEEARSYYQELAFLRKLIEIRTLIEEKKISEAAGKLTELEIPSKNVASQLEPLINLVSAALDKQLKQQEAAEQLEAVQETLRVSIALDGKISTAGNSLAKHVEARLAANRQKLGEVQKRLDREIHDGASWTRHYQRHKEAFWKIALRPLSEGAVEAELQAANQIVKEHFKNPHTVAEFRKEQVAFDAIIGFRRKADAGKLKEAREKLGSIQNISAEERSAFEKIISEEEARLLEVQRIVGLTETSPRVLPSSVSLPTAPAPEPFPEPRAEPKPAPEPAQPPVAPVAPTPVEKVLPLAAAVKPLEAILEAVHANDRELVKAELTRMSEFVSAQAETIEKRTSTNPGFEQVLSVALLASLLKNHPELFSRSDRDKIEKVFYDALPLNAEVAEKIKRFALADESEDQVKVRSASGQLNELIAKPLSEKVAGELDDLLLQIEEVVESGVIPIAPIPSADLTDAKKFGSSLHRLQAWLQNLGDEKRKAAAQGYSQMMENQVELRKALEKDDWKSAGEFFRKLPANDPKTAEIRKIHFKYWAAQLLPALDAAKKRFTDGTKRKDLAAELKPFEEAEQAFRRVKETGEMKDAYIPLLEALSEKYHMYADFSNAISHWTSRFSSLAYHVRAELRSKAYAFDTENQFRTGRSELRSNEVGQQFNQRFSPAKDGLAQAFTRRSVAAETTKPITVQQISPRSLIRYADKLQEGFDALGQSIKVQTLSPGNNRDEAGVVSSAESASVDISLVQIHGSYSEVSIGNGNFPGQVVVLIHRPEEFLSRYNTPEKRAPLLGKAGGIVLLGPASLADYQRLYPDKAVVSIPHGFFDSGVIDETRFVDGAVSTIGSITTWDKKDMRHISDALNLIEEVRKRSEGHKILGYLGHTAAVKDDLSVYQGRPDIWLLSNAELEELIREGGVTNSSALQQILYEKSIVGSAKRTIIRTEAAPKGSQLEKLESGLIDFNLQLYREVTSNGKAKVEYSGTLHLMGAPSIYVVLDSSAMRDVAQNEGIELVQVPISGSEINYEAGAEQIVALIKNPARRRTFLENNVRSAKNLGMDTIAFAYQQLFEKLIYQARQEKLILSAGDLSTAQVYSNYSQDPTLGITEEDFRVRSSRVKSYLVKRESWIKPRRQVQEVIEHEVVDEIRRLSNYLSGLAGRSVIVLLRGNTGAGKTTTIEGHPWFSGAPRNTRGKIPGVINPDAIVAHLRNIDRVDGQRTTNYLQAFLEANVITRRIRAAAEQEKLSFVLDKRFEEHQDIEDIVRFAQENGYVLRIIDVDAPLDLSINRVLARDYRNPESDAPWVDLNDLREGFSGVRKNRAQLLRTVQTNPTITHYELFGTLDGEAQDLVARKDESGFAVHDQAFLERITDPASASDDEMDRIANSPAGGGRTLRQELERHIQTYRDFQRSELRAGSFNRRGFVERLKARQSEVTLKWFLYELLKSNIELMRVTTGFPRADGADLEKVQAEFRELILNLAKIFKLAKRDRSQWATKRGLRREVLNSVAQAGVLMIANNNRSAASASLNAAVTRLWNVYLERISTKLGRIRRYRQNHGTFYQDSKTGEWVLLRRVYRDFKVGEDFKVPVAEYKEIRYKTMWEAFRSVDHEIDNELQYESALNRASKKLAVIERDLATLKDQAQGDESRKAAVIRNLEALIPELNSKWIIEKELAQFGTQATLYQTQLNAFGPAHTSIGLVRRLLDARAREVKSMIDAIEGGRLKEMRRVLEFRDSEFLNEVTLMEIALRDNSRAAFDEKADKMLSRLRNNQEPDLLGVSDLIRGAKRTISEMLEASNRGDLGRAGEKRTQTQKYLSLAKKLFENASALHEWMASYRGHFTQLRREGKEVDEAQRQAFQAQFQVFIQEQSISERSLEATIWWYRFYQTVFIPLNIDDPKKADQRIANPVFLAFSALIRMLEINDIAAMIRNGHVFHHRHDALKAFLQSVADKGKIAVLAGAEKEQMLRALAEDFSKDSKVPVTYENLRAAYEYRRHRSELRKSEFLERSDFERFQEMLQEEARKGLEETSRKGMVRRLHFLFNAIQAEVFYWLVIFEFQNRKAKSVLNGSPMPEQPEQLGFYRSLFEQPRDASVFVELKDRKRTPGARLRADSDRIYAWSVPLAHLDDWRAFARRAANFIYQSDESIRRQLKTIGFDDLNKKELPLIVDVDAFEKEMWRVLGAEEQRLRVKGDTVALIRSVEGRKELTGRFERLFARPELRIDKQDDGAAKITEEKISEDEELQRQVQEFTELIRNIPTGASMMEVIQSWLERMLPAGQIQQVPKIFGALDSKLTGEEKTQFALALYQIFSGQSFDRLTQFQSNSRIPRTTPLIDAPDGLASIVSVGQKNILQLEFDFSDYGNGNSQSRVNVFAGSGAINAPRNLRNWTGFSPILTGFLGGSIGGLAADIMEREGLSTALISGLPENTGFYLVFHDGAGNEYGMTTKLATISGADQGRVFNNVWNYLKFGDYLILIGGKSPGLGDDFFVPYLRRAHQEGILAVLDTRAKMLQEAVPEKPYLLSINHFEFADYLQRQGLRITAKDLLKDDAKLMIKHAVTLVENGIPKVNITMGADGMILVAQNQNQIKAWRATMPSKIQAVSTTMAGDTVTAALVYQLRKNANMETLIRFATAAATLKVTKGSNQIPELDEIIEWMPQVKVVEIPIRSEPREVSRSELRKAGGRLMPNARLSLMTRNHRTPGTVLLDAKEMNAQRWNELFILATTYPNVKFVVYSDKQFSNEGVVGELRDLSNVVISRDGAETAFANHALRDPGATSIHLSSADVESIRRKFQAKNQSRIVFARHNPQAMSLLETTTYLLLYAESGNSLYNIVARDGTIRSELRYMAIVQEHLNQLVISIAA